MARAGFTAREIGRALDCSHTQVLRVLAKDGPIPIAPVTIHALDDGHVVLDTDEPQIVAVAVRRALNKAGIETNVRTEG